jgi:diguanylate cyclase (GGDEF)-like protein
MEALEEPMKMSDNAAERTDNQDEDISVWSFSVICKTLGPALSLAAGIAIVMAIAKVLQVYLQEDSMRVLHTVLVAAAICMAGAMTLRHSRQWVIPSERMRRLIHEVRVGRAPIEEFKTFHHGSLNELAKELKLLLEDLRQQRHAIVKMNQEVRERIANRNSVLEGTIASLRHQAVRDSLTGLYNRRMLDDLLPQLVARQLEAGNKSLTLIMIDLDYFKKLNDHHGHAAGDELLKSIGEIIRSTIRDADFGFRYGGDEFVLLLPGCDTAAARRVGERLQSLVKSLGKTYKLAQSVRLSFGISTLSESPQPNAADLLKRADQRLYEAKARRGQAAPSPAVAA